MSEANIQAEFYHWARVANLPVTLEFATPVGRLDIAVLNRERTAIRAIVECKRRAVSFRSGESGQIQRYKAIGVPVYGLAAMEDCERLVRVIAQAVEGRAGVLIRDLPIVCARVAEGMRERREARRKARWGEHLNMR